MKPQEIGSKAPDFTLASVDGGHLTLSRILDSGKGAVVVFWSGVCSHCVRYDDYLNSFSTLHPELELVVVSSRQGESLEEIRKVKGDRRLRFNILYDSGGVVAGHWFTRQTPRAHLIAQDGTLLYRGAIDNFKFEGDPEYEAYLDPAVTSYLAGEKIACSETASFGCAIQSVYYRMPKQL